LVASEVADLLLEELAQRDLRPPLDLEPDEAVDLLPVPLLQALVAEVDYYGEHRAKVVHVLLRGTTIWVKVLSSV